MIDIHTHVLPMVDDGSDSWLETEEIFHKMASLGYSGIVATPHWAVGMPNIHQAAIEQARDLAARYQIRLSMARECRIHPQLADQLAANAQLRFDGGAAVLVELPWGPLPPYTLPVFRRLIETGYRPVLAHPARHPELWEQGSPLEALLRMDVPVQVNLSTLAGSHGKSAQRRALRLIELGLVSIVASDIHAASDIDEMIVRPLRLLRDLVGPIASEMMLKHNPQMLLESRPVTVPAHLGDDHRINVPLMKRLTKSGNVLNRIFNAFS